MRGSLAAFLTPLLLSVAAMIVTAASVQAQSSKVLDATDHAELRAEVQRDGLVRVALLHDRIARVVHGPNASFGVEHDASAGDIFLRRAEPVESVADALPEKLYIGSERGFTYALRLTPAAGGAAQLLIRNPAIDEPGNPAAAIGGDARVSEIANLVRAVANREPLPGFWVEPGGRDAVPLPGVVLLESWRGARWEALVLALDAQNAVFDAAALAGHFPSGIVAAWIDGLDASGTRLAVIVRNRPEERAMRGGADHAGR